MADIYEMILSGIGAQVGRINYNALRYWADSEGMPVWENNPLATTLSGYGGKVVNSAGVKAYPTASEGAAATAATLRFSAYRQVVSALRDDNSLYAIWDAVNMSPWCSGCQGGYYPVVLHQHAGSGGTYVPPSGGGGSGSPGGGGSGGHPRSGKQWNNLQNHWRYLGSTIGPWQKNLHAQMSGIIHKRKWRMKS